MIGQVANRAAAMYEASGRQAEPGEIEMDLRAADAFEVIDWRAFLDAPDPQFAAALAWCRASRAKREQWRRKLPEFIHRRQEVAA